MLNLFADILIKAGEFVAQTGNTGCWILYFLDEPDCPKTLIK